MAEEGDSQRSTPFSSRCISPAPFKPVPSSKRVSRALIEPLLSRPDRIRNVCILAHVDHGKTTLTDSLLASNGIISFKQAGTLRYMDAREDEQERGITMESSAVSLLFDHRTCPSFESASGVTSKASASEVGSIMSSMEGLSVGNRRFLINLIDSPGHVDFSSQVMTAAKLCDGCLVLVDAVEGVCTQTAAVLRQAHQDRLKPCLVVNKMDRLVSELKLSTTEASAWLIKLLEQVNAIQAAVSGYPQDEAPGGRGLDGVDEASPRHAEDDDSPTFCPTKGNVIFASATDGWAFRTGLFACILSRRLDMNEAVLQRTLWGEYFFDAKGKRVVGKRGAERLGLEKPLFAQLILDNIWTIYEATSKDGWDQAKIEKIAGGLSVRLPARELKARDGKSLLRAVLTSWLPLAECAFAAIVECLPNPLEAANDRIPHLLKRSDDGAEDEEAEAYPERTKTLIDALCRTASEPFDSFESSPTVAYLSKQFAVSCPAEVEVEGEESERAAEVGVGRINEKLYGMARLFHGTLSVGQTVYILRPKYDPAHPDPQQYVEVVVGELYLLMGRDLEAVERVYAGNVFGIGGLERWVGKSATITDSLECPSFDVINAQKAVPIVRVAVHPTSLQHMPQLESGLKLLCQADPCAETFLMEETGEHILAAAGELHLEQCLKDLRERFTKVDIGVSPPMVPFRETITADRAINDSFWREGLSEARGEGASSDGILTLSTSSGACRLSVRAVPLAEGALQCLAKHKVHLRQLFGCHGNRSDPLLKTLADQLSTASRLLNGQVRTESILALGPKREGTNVLLGSEKFLGGIAQHRALVDSLLVGFQMAVEQGPLCAEPVMGVAFVLENVVLEEAGRVLCEAESAQRYYQVKGQLISLMKDACHRAFHFHSPRLLLAMYSCDIQTTAEVLGRVYSVISRRLGQILSEDYNEGTGFFTVKSLIPVPESFGFADDIRGKTSGLAIPQLLFSGFRVFDQDPFWVPSTEEELEEFGEKAERANVALRYLIGVRERKGMSVEKKIVQFAEKQRTLKK